MSASSHPIVERAGPGSTPPLEDLTASLPAVPHVVVVGAPDARFGLGEVPIACVELRSGARLTLPEIEALLTRHGVTRRFWPVGLRIFDEWPLGLTGKIDRRLVLARLAVAR